MKLIKNGLVYKYIAVYKERSQWNGLFDREEKLCALLDEESISQMLGDDSILICNLYTIGPKPKNWKALPKCQPTGVFLKKKHLAPRTN
jgi:hypothetical protein